MALINKDYGGFSNRFFFHKDSDKNELGWNRKRFGERIKRSKVYYKQVKASYSATIVGFITFH